MLVLPGTAFDQLSLDCRVFVVADAVARRAKLEGKKLKQRLAVFIVNRRQWKLPYRAW